MARFAALEMLAEEEQRRVLAAATRRRYERGDVVFHQGDPGGTFHLVDRGRIKIATLLPTGESTTLAILGPGESFGEQALLTPDAARTATATALEPAQTLMIDGDDFHALRARHPEVNEFLVQVLAGQVRRLGDELAEARYVGADQRIGRQVLRLADLYGNGAKYTHIFEANRDILDDPDRIFPGQELKIPDLDD